MVSNFVSVKSVFFFIIIILQTVVTGIWLYFFQGHNMAEDYWHAGSRFKVPLSSLLLLLLLSVCASAQRTLSSSGKRRSRLNY